MLPGHSGLLWRHGGGRCSGVRLAGMTRDGSLKIFLPVSISHFPACFHNNCSGGYSIYYFLIFGSLLRLWGEFGVLVLRQAIYIYIYVNLGVGR